MGASTRGTRPDSRNGPTLKGRTSYTCSTCTKANEWMSLNKQCLAALRHVRIVGPAAGQEGIRLSTHATLDLGQMQEKNVV